MAERPVFILKKSAPYYETRNIPFKYFPGFAESQKKKCVESLHQSICATYRNARVLEISTKSEIQLGIELSAFNLGIKTQTSGQVSVEMAFQSSKVFENGGPYIDILQKTSREAKRDPRLRTSGNLIRFCFEGQNFPLNPKNFFYNWLYIKALLEHEDLAEESLNYNAFTDIEFNPQKSINCQACAVAQFVSLKKAELLGSQMLSLEEFLQKVYNISLSSNEDNTEQINLFNV